MSTLAGVTEPQWLDEQEDRAWRGLMAMEEGLTAFIDRQLRTRCGLSHADYRVLAHLSEAPGQRLRSFELGDLLHWEKSRLSQHLSRMQTRGLVTRARSETDLRGAVVSITPRGQELITTAAQQHVADARDTVIDQLTAPELRALLAITDKVRRRLAALESADPVQS